MTILNGVRALVCVASLLVLAIAPHARAAELSPWSEGGRPNFDLDSLSGDRVSLAAHENRVVLVHFFATWCEPCRVEIVALQRLSEQLSPAGVTILAIDAGEVDPRVRRFFEATPVDFPVLLDRDSAVTKAWQVTILPTTFVLDRSLAPRFVAEGDLDWAQPEVHRKLDALARNETRD